MPRPIYGSFVLLAVLVTLWEIGQLLAPIAGVLLTAVVCAFSFHGLYARCQRMNPRWNPSVCAALADFFVFVFILAPLFLLTWAVVQEAAMLQPIIKEWRVTMDALRQGQFSSSLPWLQNVRFFFTHTVGMTPAEFKNNLINGASGFLDAISIFGTELTKHSIELLFDSLLTVFTLFFLFRDGPRFAEYIERLIPLGRENKQMIEKRVHDVIVGVARGWLLTSLIQGILSMGGYLLVGVPGAVLLGVLTAVAGLMPVVGTVVIWGPVGVVLCVQGHLWKGIVILTWGAFVVVGLADSVLRPYLVGRKMHVPVFPLFLALLGGAEAWGAKGIILGPLLISVAPILFEVYRQHYLSGVEPD